MIHVTRLGEMKGASPVRTAAPGRVCQQFGCGTRLSVYNAQPFCGVHSHDIEEPPPAGRNRCPECGIVLDWTSTYFHRDPHGSPQKLHRICKECRNINNRVASRESCRRARMEELDP